MTKYKYFKIWLIIFPVAISYSVYVAYTGLRMSAPDESPEDIHCAVENENTVSAYLTSQQILPFGFAEL